MAPRPTAAPLALLAAACGTSSLQPGSVGEAPATAVAVESSPDPPAVALAEPSGEPAPAAEALGGRPYELIEGEPMITVLPQDAIPALDAPRFVSAEQALDFMQPDETVLGVVGKDGTAKCYSAWQLDGHEIVNDELDGEPIAATW